MDDLMNMGPVGVAMANLLGWFFGQNKEISDEEFVEYYDEVWPAIVNGDPIYYGDEDDPERYSSHELRQQWTPEQAEEIRKEYEWRKNGGNTN